LELAQESPKTWQLEGYDINSNQLPATEYLPHNVTLRVLDVFDEIPKELVAKFDVVHVRTFAAIIKNNNPVPFLEHMMRMLSEFFPFKGVARKRRTVGDERCDDMLGGYGALQSVVLS